MPLPDIKHCIICEDVRVERRNLSSFMGVYGATPHVGIRLRNFQLPAQFKCVFMGAPAQGKFVIVPEIRSPDGTRINAEVQPVGFEFTFSADFAGSILAFWFKAKFPGPNTYTVVLMHNNDVFFSDTFKLEQAKDADFA
jgi:hypothetical protein